MENFQYPNNKFPINFNDQKSQFENRACEIPFFIRGFLFDAFPFVIYLKFGA
jgi:hypothetical protein